jgi:DNA-binding transcriptional MerR regulator
MTVLEKSWDLLATDCDTNTVTVVNVATITQTTLNVRRTDEGEGPAVTSELLTLEDITKRVGMSVRNVRFYTTKGLVPPPIRRGRSGYYTNLHVARLELVRELQGHGFTLSAIERYLSRVPEHATPEDLALQRTMLAPWSGDRPVAMSRTDLEERAGRALTEEDVATLEAIGVLTPDGPAYAVSLTQLPVGLGLLELGFPTDAALAAKQVYLRHGQEIAEELYEVFRTMVWPLYQTSGASPELLREIVERLKPLSISSLVLAYTEAMDEAKRQGIRRRSS